MSASLEIDEQLQRISASGYLGRSGRLQLILEYIVAEAAAGRGKQIKAYSIAVDCLGRPESFDPAVDSIVRVEVGRLRRALQDYYTTIGANDPIQIEVPKGQYRPAFINLDIGSAEFRSSRLVLLVTLAAVVGVAILAFAYFLLPISPQTSKPPVLAVKPFTQQTAPEPSDNYYLVALESQFLRELSRFRTLRVRRQAPRDIERSVEGQADYLLTGTLYHDTNSDRIDIDLFDQMSGTLKWTTSFSIDRNDPNQAAAVLIQIRRVAANIGSPGGLVASEALQRMERVILDSPDEYACQLIWYAFDTSKKPELETRAKKCLTKLTLQNSQNSEIWSSFAFFRFLEWTKLQARKDHPLLDEAVSAANRSIQLDPGNPDGHEYLGSILMAQGHFDDAFQSYKLARKLNPSKPDLTVWVGWFHALRGKWELGIPLVEEGVALSLSPPGWFRIPLALNFFRTGDYERSFSQAKLMIAAGDDRGIVLALAAAAALKSDIQIQKFSELLTTRALTLAEALAEIRAVFDQAEILESYAAILSSVGEI